jgi:nicotinate-nucleotide adenylyltransferase
MTQRIGIFGGTFNPPHIGHIEAAKAFLDKAKLDKLIIMPAFIPPHKEHDVTVSCEARIDMCKIAFGNIPKAEVSDLEITRGGKSYTYLTLEELKSADKELYFLCGTDMILTMDNWKNPDIIFSLANICYIRRESDEQTTNLIQEKCEEYLNKFGASVLPIDADVIEISSSEIRNNTEIRNEYLTSEVAEYIKKAGLYK